MSSQCIVTINAECLHTQVYHNIYKPTVKSGPSHKKKCELETQIPCSAGNKGVISYLLTYYQLHNVANANKRNFGTSILSYNVMLTRNLTEHHTNSVYYTKYLKNINICHFSMNISLFWTQSHPVT